MHNSNGLLTQLQTQIHTYFPHPPSFLVALSGGVDSVVLLHLLHRLKLPLRAVHVHHGLSPNADQWVAFCQHYCQQQAIPLCVKYVQVNGKKGIEAEAREKRYQAIRETREHNEVVVTAHHLDDQAETFLLALKRGSGVKGLSAMQAVNFSQKFPIFRPLLAVSKNDILAYAQSQNLSWIEDESNQSTDYDRNFLRHKVLPVLNEQWEQFNRMVARSCEHLAHQQQLLDELLSEELAKYRDGQTLVIQDFAGLTKIKQQALLRLWLSEQQMLMPSTAQLEQIIQNIILAKEDKNPEIQLGDKMLRRYQNRLFITPIYTPVATFSKEIQQQETIILPNGLGQILRAKDEIIYQTAHKIDHLQLSEALQQEKLFVHLKYQGKIKEYGKTYHEEMKKIWQKYQIPVWERERTPLILKGDILLKVFKS